MPVRRIPSLTRSRLSQAGWALLLGFVLAGCAAPTPEPPQPAALRPVGSAFTDVTTTAGLSAFRHETGAAGKMWFPETMGAGGAFLDYDGDGWTDLLLVAGAAWPETDGAGRAADVPALRLYRNLGDGTFSETTGEAGLASVRTYGMGLAVADYDNDGDADVFFTTLREDLLFRNDCGTFTEVGRAAGVTGPASWSTAAVFFDADRDGRLDLYVGSYVDWSPEKDFPCLLDRQRKGYCTPEVYAGLAGRFYHNEGDGRFSDWTRRAGFLPAPGKTMGAVAMDFNRDGWPDLAVANDTQRNLLYVNNGDGTFTERGMTAGIAFDEHGFARAGMGVDAGDVDASGEVTLSIGNFSREMIAMYRHTGDGLFQDRAARSGVGPPSLLTLTFGLFLFDVDLDGDLDLFAANGHIQTEIERIQAGVTYRQPPQLFLNQGDGTFAEADTTNGSVLAQPLVARGAAYADVDRDGDLDVLITENGGPVHLWRNDLQGGRFLRVHLEGRASNRSGLGSRVVLVADGQRQSRYVRAGASYLSASEQVATFGLGTAHRVDSLFIHWPSGQIDRFTDLAPGVEVRIVEGAEVPRPPVAPPPAMP